METRRRVSSTIPVAPIGNEGVDSLHGRDGADDVCEHTDDDAACEREQECPGDQQAGLRLAVEAREKKAA